MITFPVYAVKKNLFEVNKMKFLQYLNVKLSFLNTLLFMINMTTIPSSLSTSRESYPSSHPYTPMVAFGHNDTSRRRPVRGQSFGCSGCCPKDVTGNICTGASSHSCRPNERCSTRA